MGRNYFQRTSSRNDSTPHNLHPHLDSSTSTPIDLPIGDCAITKRKTVSITTAQKAEVMAECSGHDYEQEKIGHLPTCHNLQ